MVLSAPKSEKKKPAFPATKWRIGKVEEGWEGAGPKEGHFWPGQEKRETGAKVRYVALMVWTLFLVQDLK